jgi:hypothetical protein
LDAICRSVVILVGPIGGISLATCVSTIEVKRQRVLAIRKFLRLLDSAIVLDSARNGLQPPARG